MSEPNADTLVIVIDPISTSGFLFISLFLFSLKTQGDERLELNLTKEKSNCNEFFDTALVDDYLTWKDVRNSGPGFKNLGNSCYQNAAIQCLFAVPPFFQLLVQDEVKLGKQDVSKGILDTLRR